jgi:site-specific recombinase XerD
MSLSTKDELIAAIKAKPLDKHYDELFTRLRAERDKPMGEAEKLERAKELVAALGPYPHELRFEAADLVIGRRYTGLEDWLERAPRDTDFDVTSYAVALAQGDKVQPRLTLRDALKLYLRDRRDKGVDNRAKFERDRERSIERLITHLNGDRFVGDVSRTDARSYVDKAQRTYKPESVNKEVHLFKAVFNTAYRELELDKRNPWEELQVHDDVPDRDKRDSFTIEQGRTVLDALDTSNPDLRRIGFITAFTGARLKEVSGLLAEDVDLAAETPTLTIYPNAVRTVKNKASRRVIAPVGPALEALREAREAHPSGPLFPRYADEPAGATNASAALVSVLRKRVGIKDKKLVWHSWRHTMKDLLRNAGVPTAIQNRILGHSGEGVGDNYGRGHDMKLLAEALAKAIEPLVRGEPNV